MIPPSLPNHHLQQQPQPLLRKFHHIPHPIPAQPGFHLARKHPPLTSHRQRHIPGRPIGRIAPRWPCSSTLRERIRTLQLPTHMFCQTRHDIRRRTFVVRNRLLRPPSVTDARGKRVERQTAFVEFRSAGSREEGGTDEASAGGFGDGDGFVAGFEEVGDLGEEVVELGGWEGLGEFLFLLGRRGVGRRGG